MTTTQITITWFAEDGYVSKDRPKHTTIHLCEFIGTESDDEIRQHIEDCIGDDFQAKVSPGWKESDMDAAVEAIKRGIADELSNEDQAS